MKSTAVTSQAMIDDVRALLASPLEDIVGRLSSVTLEPSPAPERLEGLKVQ